jgi:transposase
MTDAEWALIEPHLPPPRRLGRPRTTELRSVVDGLLYILATGCQWRLLPRDFPPYSTVQRFFYRWREAGIWQRVNHDLMMRAREAEGRAASPSVGRRDRQPEREDHRGRRTARV